MKNNYYKMNLLLVSLILLLTAVSLCTAEDGNKEDQLKAAFLYNFLKFIDWPADKLSDNNEPAVIGIYGGGDFIKAFEPLKDKTLGSRKVVVKGLACADKNISAEELNKQIESFAQCHILFFVDCPDDVVNKQILDVLNAKGVLTVGQNQKFLESSGNINFLIEENKLRFEINLISAKNNNLKIRSNLLKLAKRVIDANGD